MRERMFLSEARGGSTVVSAKDTQRALKMFSCALFVGAAGGAFSVANDEVGIRELLKQLKPADFVILEALIAFFPPGRGF